ncbi:MAG TPA: hypothetical protein PL065_10020, partial [Polyangiaceae bacterium]|nr:hypothetical protein [Polyangiaceae bacterium]
MTRNKAAILVLGPILCLGCTYDFDAPFAAAMPGDASADRAPDGHVADSGSDVNSSDSWPVDVHGDLGG